MMQTASNLFENELRKLLEAEIAEFADQLTRPGAAFTFEEYRFRVGHIQGLREALAMCDDANRKIEERD